MIVAPAVRLLERGLWAIARRAVGTEVVGGLEFVDVRGLRKPDEVLETLQEALQLLEAAGADFKEIVIAELRFVGATRDQRERVARHLRAYLSPFLSHERSNAGYLATRLVWTAAFFRAIRESTDEPPEPRESLARRKAAEAEFALVAELPNADSWFEYLRRQNLTVT